MEREHRGLRAGSCAQVSCAQENPARKKSPVCRSSCAQEILCAGPRSFFFVYMDSKDNFPYSPLDLFCTFFLLVYGISWWWLDGKLGFSLSKKGRGEVALVGGALIYKLPRSFQALSNLMYGFNFRNSYN